MKYNFLLISFIVIIIFLGILWLINNKGNKEGLTGDSETTTSSSAISPSAVESVVTTIESSVNNALSDAGIQTIDKKQFESIMTELNTIVASEADAIKQKAEEDAKHAADIANTVDTTPSIYQANTYFQGLKVQLVLSATCIFT